MSFFFNGAQANATITSTGSALLSATATRATTGTTTIFTTTAGKTARVKKIALSLVNEGAGTHTVKINNDGAVVYTIAWVQATAAASNLYGEVVDFGDDYLSVAATKVLQLESVGNQSCNVQVFYYEV